MQVITVNYLYATALRRLAAWFIDMAFVSFVMLLLRLLNFDFHYGFFFHGLPGAKWLVTLCYFAIMECSSYQGTFGKIILGIQVIDAKGQRLPFSRALLRNLSKFISAAVFCIGYLLILFDSRRQGLHDKIADALVVRR